MLLYHWDQETIKSCLAHTMKKSVSRAILLFYTFLVIFVRGDVYKRQFHIYAMTSLNTAWTLLNFLILLTVTIFIMEVQTQTTLTYSPVKEKETWYEFKVTCYDLLSCHCSVQLVHTDQYKVLCVPVSGVEIYSFKVS